MSPEEKERRAVARRFVQQFNAAVRTSEWSGDHAQADFIDYVARGPLGADTSRSVVWREFDVFWSAFEHRRRKDDLNSVHYWLDDRWHCVGTDDDSKPFTTWLTPYSPAYAEPTTTRAIQTQLSDYKVVLGRDQFVRPEQYLRTEDVQQAAQRLEYQIGIGNLAYRTPEFCLVAAGAHFVADLKGANIFGVEYGPAAGPPREDIETWVKDSGWHPSLHARLYSWLEGAAQLHAHKIPFDGRVYDRRVGGRQFLGQVLRGIISWQAKLA
jgi:hypothetical protein